MTGKGWVYGKEGLIGQGVGGTREFNRTVGVDEIDRVNVEGTGG